MKKYLIIFMTAVLVFVLAACGSSSDPSAEDGTDENILNTADEGAENVGDAVHPYAWLGLQDMPDCDYLNILATNRYYRKADMYIAGMSYVSHEIKAVDGINTYEEDETKRVYSIEGKILSLNEDSKTYMEEDMSDMAESAAEQYDDAIKNGTNLSGRSFTGTGTEAVPIYSEQTDDKAEYEYYEYNYPELEESGDSSTVERFYLKDGDVFAIYTKTTWGDLVIESTEIIQEMSGEIPAGTFELPDLSGYEKTEL